MSKKEDPKKVFNSVNHTRDSLSGRFMSKPNKKVKDIAEKKKKKAEDKFKKKVSSKVKSAKLSRKIKNKRLK